MALNLKPVNPAQERRELAEIAAAPAEPQPLATVPESGAEPATSPDASAKRPKKEPAASVSKPKLTSVVGAPYESERRVQFSSFFYPSLWAKLDEFVAELEDGGRKASAPALVVALLHFHMPSGGEEAVEVARRFTLRLAGADGERLYDGEQASERNVRIFASQRDQLRELGKRVEAGLGRRYGRMLLINAVLEADMPADAAEAERLLQAFELVRLGDSETAKTILGVSAKAA